MSDDWKWTDAAASRLRMLAREHGKQDELVETSGIPKATLQRILAGKSDPGPERFQLLVDAIGADHDAVLKGGDPLAGKIAEIPINDIQVSAGPGRFALDEDEKIGSWPLPRDWLADRFSDLDLLRFVRIVGDSQYPELRDGDLVLINLGEQRLQEGMHVVSLDDGLMIKRIQLEGARVRLKSANPNYDDIVLNLAEDQDRFRVVAKAGWTIKTL